MLAPIPIHIPKDLLEPAALRSFEGAAPGFELHLGVDDLSFETPVRWSVDVTNTGGALLVSGTAEARAACACARCLEEAAFDLKGDVEGFFLIPGQEAQLDGEEEDEFETLPDDGRIDLAPLIQAALVLEAPRVPLCRESCAGICPTCGANLNEGPCSCEPEEPSDAGNPFAALKDIDFS